jgi:hypothetical protein
MRVSDADAPKPPAYPFSSKTVKEPSPDKKRAIRQLLGVSLRALSPDFPIFHAVLPELRTVTVAFPFR